ncbi:MAG TPA: ATP-grasp domain-containing protein [Candidatus Saccharimonadales bacterium]|nr:ATP-grasp domain-containing protein [Candidatus Saccharimonadales bacterium]
MLWIVGKTFSEFRQYLETRGTTYGIFWDQTLELPQEVTAPVVRLNFSQAETITVQLQEYPELDVSAIIVAGYENYVLPAAYIAAFYGVPGPSPQAALAATDKAVMRQMFLDYDTAISPQYAAVSDWHDVVSFMKNHEFPVVLKPASLMKSLLITKSSSMTELQENYEETARQIQKLYRKYSVGQVPKIIIEEFLEGSMHTVAGFADANGQPLLIPGVVDCITGQQIGHDDNFLYARTLPTRLPAAEQERIMHVAAEGIQALGLRSCPAHVELMLTKTGPKIIEIGARIGGYRPRMYEYAYGIDLQAIMLAIARGEIPQITPTLNRSISVFELFPDTEGPYEALSNEAQLSSLPSLRRLSIKPDKGQIIGRSSRGYKAAAVVILGHDDSAQLQKDSDFIRSQVRVELGG